MKKYTVHFDYLTDGKPNGLTDNIKIIAEDETTARQNAQHYLDTRKINAKVSWVQKDEEA